MMLISKVSKTDKFMATGISTTGIITSTTIVNGKKQRVKLVYTSDSSPGITRIKKNKKFEYYLKGKKIKDEITIKRIFSLVIPPAWENVWICVDEKGHLQATGLDAKQRKQYRYHPLWSSFRNLSKFSTMLDFGKSLPKIRKQIEDDINQNTDAEKKVIALVLSLMDKTYIRIGSSFYEKEYGSHGLSTLKDKHVQINSDKITFLFTGKKGVSHNITLKNKKLAKLVKQCRDIPGKELFQYYTSDGIRKKVESGMVNNYIKEISQKEFTSKDFRTWAGSVNALKFINENKNSERRLKSNEIIDHVSKELGNTRAVCKKYYIHPTILELYEQNELPLMKKTTSQRLTNEEKWLLDILTPDKSIS